MTMRETFNIEHLSAYLDNELAPAERAHVDTVLASDPAAAAALSELRYTKAVLADTPRLATPRAFTLNEAMLQPPQPRRSWRSWLQPAYLRGAGVLASLALLVLVMGDLSVRAQMWNSAPTERAAQLGGLAADQGDPTAILGKTSTDPVVLAPAGFLGIPATTLLVVEIVLAILAIGLLVAARQMSRAP